MSQKVCFIIPQGGRKLSTHNAYLLDFIDEVSENIQTYTIIEAEQTFKWKPLRTIENLVLCYKARRKGFNTFYVHYSYIGALNAKIITTLFGGKVYYWNCGNMWFFGKQRFLRFILKMVDYLVTGNETMKQGYHKHLNVPLEKIKIMPNWVDLNRFNVQDEEAHALRQELGIPEDAPVILYLHRLAERKGSRYLPEIAKLVTDQIFDTHFIIAGDGPDEEWIKDQFKDKDNVHILGSWPNDKVPLIMDASDVYIMPSEEEGFPRVIIEAQASGLLYAAFDIGGTREISPKEQQEYIVPVGDVSEISKSIISIIQLDENSKLKLKQTLKNHVLQYDKKTVAKRFLEMVLPTKLKVLFAGRAVSDFMRYKTIFKTLCERGHSVILMFDKEWSKDHLSNTKEIELFASKHPTFTFKWLVRRNDFWRKVLIRTRAIIDYRKYLFIKNSDDYFLLVHKRFLPPVIRSLTRFTITNALIRSRITLVFLKLVERVAPAGKNILSLLKQYNPDVVLVSPVTMRLNDEIEYLKAAKKLGIPTVLPVYSWDNLTVRGIIHVIPDLLLAWNKTHAQEAHQYHNIPKEKIRITGSPFFDEWFLYHKPSQTREEFCVKYGLDPKDPILLYLGSSIHMAHDESWLVKDLRKYLDESGEKNLQQVQIMVRPHPAHAEIYKRIESDKIIMVPKVGELPNSKDERQLLFNSVYYSFANIGVNTSAQIDALILNQPGMCFITKKYEDTQSKAEHFQLLTYTDVIEFVKTREQFLNATSNILSGTDKKKELRNNFINTVVRPRGLNRDAGDLAAEEIEHLVHNF